MLLKTYYEKVQEKNNYELLQGQISEAEENKTIKCYVTEEDLIDVPFRFETKRDEQEKSQEESFGNEGIDKIEESNGDDYFEIQDDEFENQNDSSVNVNESKDDEMQSRLQRKRKPPK